MAVVLVAAATVTALGPAAAAAGQSWTGGAQALAAGDITTVAGGKGPGPAPATSVAFTPCGVSFVGGSVYAAAGQTVRQVAMQTDQLTTPAGTGSFGPLGDGGIATRAYLNNACGTTVDGSGNLIIADENGERVRAVAATTGTFWGQAMHKGDIYTIAGGGDSSPADGVPATSALIGPNGVAVDAAGNLVIADRSNKLLEVVAAGSGTFYGQAMTAGDLYIVAGGGFNGLGDGGPATFAEVGPDGVALDAAGNLVISDAQNSRIRVVAVSTGTFYGQAMKAGDIYTVAGGGTGPLGDGGPAIGAALGATAGVALDAAGNLVIAGENFDRVRVVAVRTGTFYGRSMTAGDIYTVAGNGSPGFSGDGGPASTAQLSAPSGVAVDSAGNLVIADQSNNRVRVVAAKNGTFYGQAMTAHDIYTVGGNGQVSYSGDRGPATQAQFNRPGWVTVDAAGNMLISDGSNFRIRAVAAVTGRFYGQAMTAGNVYTIAGNGVRESTSQGFLRSGVRATKTAVLAGAVTLDRAGNLLLAEGRGVRVVAVRTGTFYGQAMTAGDIYRVAGNGGVGFSGDGGPATSAEFDGVAAVAADAAGNLLLADSQNGRIRVVAARTSTFYGIPMTAGDVYSIAGVGGTGDGGPAITASLNQPLGLTLDAAGNVVISDTGDRRVRVIAATSGTFYGQAMTANDIYTVAGGGTSAPGDRGPATSAELGDTFGVTFDSHGSLVFTEIDAGAAEVPRVRVVAGASGTFYGQAMTKGDIYTVAGGNPTGFSGDGGPATSAQLNNPFGVAADGPNLLVADSGNNRIRQVAG